MFCCCRVLIIIVDVVVVWVGGCGRCGSGGGFGGFYLCVVLFVLFLFVVFLSGVLSDIYCSVHHLGLVHVTSALVNGHQFILSTTE